jgi:hypothetical protein
MNTLTHAPPTGRRTVLDDAHVGVGKYVSVPVAAAALVAMTATGSFRRWQRFMYLFVATNFVAIPLAIASHPHAGPILAHSFVPGVEGGFGSTSVLLIIAIVGTTVAPWQLFFQQSNVIDKRITPRWITTAVQGLAGVLLPSATVFLVLLCNDKAVLGPWTNRGWLNAIAAAIVGVLVVLSGILTATTLFPKVDVTLLAGILFGVLVLVLATAAIYTRAGRRPDDASPTSDVPKEQWTMPQLELLARPEWSRTRTVGMYALRGYLVVAVVMLVIKAIEVGLGH